MIGCYHHRCLSFLSLRVYQRVQVQPRVLPERALRLHDRPLSSDVDHQRVPYRVFYLNQASRVGRAGGESNDKTAPPLRQLDTKTVTLHGAIMQRSTSKDVPLSPDIFSGAGITVAVEQFRGLEAKPKVCLQNP